MNRKQFLAAMYLRLSRDDGDVEDVPCGRKVETPSGQGEFAYKAKRGCPGAYASMPCGRKKESNSIGNQRELIRAFIHEQQDMELYDIYVDDGFSGSNFVEVR